MDLEELRALLELRLGVDRQNLGESEIVSTVHHYNEGFQGIITLHCMDSLEIIGELCGSEEEARSSSVIRAIRYLQEDGGEEVSAASAYEFSREDYVEDPASGYEPLSSIEDAAQDPASGYAPSWCREESVQDSASGHAQAVSSGRPRDPGMRGTGPSSPCWDAAASALRAILGRDIQSPADYEFTLAQYDVGFQATLDLPCLGEVVFDSDVLASGAEASESAASMAYEYCQERLSENSSSAIDQGSVGHDNSGLDQTRDSEYSGWQSAPKRPKLMLRIPEPSRTKVEEVPNNPAMQSRMGRLAAAPRPQPPKQPPVFLPSAPSRPKAAQPKAILPPANTAQLKALRSTAGVGKLQLRQPVRPPQHVPTVVPPPPHVAKVEASMPDHPNQHSGAQDHIPSSHESRQPRQQMSKLALKRPAPTKMQEEKREEQPDAETQLAEEDSGTYDKDVAKELYNAEMMLGDTGADCEMAFHHVLDHHDPEQTGISLVWAMRNLVQVANDKLGDNVEELRDLLFRLRTMGWFVENGQRVVWQKSKNRIQLSKMNVKDPALVRKWEAIRMRNGGYQHGKAWY